MSHIFDEATTYRGDLDLFEELGLAPFKVPLREKHHVGNVTLDGIVVRLWVTCAPAQFWEFEFSLKGSGYKVETASGSLKLNWPTVVAIARKLKGSRRR